MSEKLWIYVLVKEIFEDEILFCLLAELTSSIFICQS